MRPTIPSTPALLVAGVAMAAAMLALVASATGSIDPGVVVDDAARVVESVEPDGPAWDAGIRAGQLVVDLRAADDPGGWEIDTTDGAVEHRFRVAVREELLRLTVGTSLLAMAVAAAAAFAAQSRPSRSELLAGLAVSLAALPWLVATPGPAGAATLVAAGAAPSIWVARRGPWRHPARWALPAASGGLVLAWLLAREAGAPVSAWLGRLAFVAAAAGAAAMLGLAVRTSRAAVARVLGAAPVLDAAVLAIVVVASLAMLGAGLPWPIALAVLILPLAAYARARLAIARLVDALLLSEVRERESIAATERERARMSREIHDDPLQEIAGAIQRLEDPDADVGAVRDSLREAAARLRGVATDLHPPVLDDLGLAPALGTLARPAGAGGPAVLVELDNRSGYDPGERAPAEVELAAYRIAGEAIANALRHARASNVTVSGTVSPRLVDLEVADDGVGIAQGAADEALRAGRLGLPSMRRRAEAVGATLDVGHGPGRGTVVRLRWVRP